MHLPSRLRATTLGDLLGALHRGSMSGTLELIEERGRTHRIHLTRGLVIAVEYDGAAVSLSEILRRERAIDEETLRRSLLRAMASRRLHGEVLVSEFRVPAEVVDRALRHQILARLAILERLKDAQVRFRVAVRPPRSALGEAPLGPGEFLAGRRRLRERGPGPRPASRPSWPPPSSVRPSSPPPSSVRPSSPPSSAAWKILGLAPGAPDVEIKRAYRRLVRSYHPDMHPGASDAERRTLQARFVEVTAAYRALVA